MRSQKCAWQWGLACLVALGLTAASRAADKPPKLDTATKAEANDKDRDGQINQTLRDVINRGAELYNTGDPAGCYHMFRGSLMTVRPFLDHRPDAQKAIDAGLAAAERNPDFRRRAWALRRVLDGVRAQVAGKGEETAKATLWQRLGGEPGVKQIIDDWFALAAPDPKVNFSRDGKFKPTDKQVAHLKKLAVEFVSQASGGPLEYTGKSMKEAHKGMGITDKEFDAIVADLIKALTKNRVKAADIEAVVGAVEKTRKDIVEAKKDDDDKKPKDEDDEKPKDKDDKKPKDEDDKKPKDKDDKKPKDEDDK
jgi:hemoglobin